MASPSTIPSQPDMAHMTTKSEDSAVHVEGVTNKIAVENNITYTDDEHEPKLHARTWIALTALCVQSFCQLFALIGPPTALGIISQDLNGVASASWVPNCMILVQAVFCNILSSASDLFQARKSLLVVCTVIAFVGAAIAPGSQSIGRLIASQTLIGASIAVIPLTFAVPSEILPTKWRPMAQAAINGAGSLGMISAPLIIGALSKRDLHQGWRTFYWIETALWGASALFLFIGYRPPTRHTRYDHLSIWQKLKQLDFIGALILAAGLSLFLTGLNIGGNLYAWVSAPTLVILLLGILGLFIFGLYEWKGTKTGILNHSLFNHNKKLVRVFVICLWLMFAEGVLVYSFIVFYPVLTQTLFETDLVVASARVSVYFIGIAVGTLFYGWLAVRLRSIREALVTGFLAALIGTIGTATIQPGQSASILVFVAFAGVGTAAVLSLAIAGVQLASPHEYLATATAVAVTFRAISSTSFTSIYSAVVAQKMESNIPNYVAKGAVAAGLPVDSVPAFILALTGTNPDQLATVPGVSESIVAAGVQSLRQASADSLRYPFIIAAPFVFLAAISAWFIPDIKSIMNYHVDAPVEKLQAKDADEKAALSA